MSTGRENGGRITSNSTEHFPLRKSSSSFLSWTSPAPHPPPQPPLFYAKLFASAQALPILFQVSKHLSPYTVVKYMKSYYIKENFKLN